MAYKVGENSWLLGKILVISIPTVSYVISIQNEPMVPAPQKIQGLVCAPAAYKRCHQCVLQHATKGAGLAGLGSDPAVAFTMKSNIISTFLREPSTFLTDLKDLGKASQHFSKQQSGYNYQVFV